MKYITKDPEPQEIIDWKENDKMFQRGKPNWNRLKASHKESLRNSTLTEQGHICCYCERRVSLQDSHLEHLKPQEKSPEAQIEYTNLLCSCQLEIEKGEPRHCGNNKGSWFDNELFISPLDANCETRFKYTMQGEILAYNENDIAAKTTIEKLKLDLPKLNDLRRKAVEPFMDGDLSLDEINKLVEGYLIEKDKNEGKYNQFYTTIKYLFS